MERLRVRDSDDGVGASARHGHPEMLGLATIETSDLRRGSAMVIAIELGEVLRRRLGF